METQKLSLYTFVKHDENEYQVLDAEGFDPIGEYVTLADAIVTCNEHNTMLVTMHLLDLDTTDDLYNYIGEAYASGNTAAAKVLYDMLPHTEMSECINHLESLYHYDAADNDQFAELQQMVNFFSYKAL